MVAPAGMAKAIKRRPMFSWARSRSPVNIMAPLVPSSASSETAVTRTSSIASPGPGVLEGVGIGVLVAVAEGVGLGPGDVAVGGMVAVGLPELKCV